MRIYRALGMVLLAAAVQPCQAYLMGRAGLPFTNAAFREVATQAIQPSACPTVLPTAVAASVLIPETLRSLQSPASIGGMASSSLGQCGRCVEESQRNGIDLSCGEFTLPAPPDTASQDDEVVATASAAAAAEATASAAVAAAVTTASVAAAVAATVSAAAAVAVATAVAAAAAAVAEEERTPITGWLDGVGLRGDNGDILVSPRLSSAPVGGLQRLGFRQRLGLSSAAPMRARVVAQASQALGGWAGRGQGGGTSPPAGGRGPPPGGGPPGGMPPPGGATCN